MNKTALVVGATGLIGKALVVELLAQSSIKKVITLTRRALSSETLGIDHSITIDPARWQNHIVDFAQLERHKHLFDHVDVVFSCLGTTKKAAGSISKQRIVDVDYQYAVAKLAQEAGVKEYFLVSSTGANRRSGSAYLKMKGELEHSVVALGFQRCVIMRPSLLLGSRQQARAGEWLAGKFLPFIGFLPVLKKYRPIKGIEVAQKMAELTVDTNALNMDNLEVYELDKVFPGAK